MKPVVMVLAMSLLCGSPCGLRTQTDSLVDVFPFAIGNQWTYRYFTLTVIWPAGNPVESRTDSGRVVYDVSSSVRNTDSTRWQFRLTRNLTRHQILYYPVSRDTNYPIRDTSFFELIENHQGQHQLYRNEDPSPIHLDVFPFTRNFTDTALIYRFRRIELGDTVAFRSSLYRGFPTPYVRSTFTFKRGIGLLRFRYNSGSLDVFDTAYHYLISSVITSTGNTVNSQPERYDLSQNYPNPFNPTTTIQFTIPVGTYSHTSLRAYDLLGREVATLVNEEKSAGTYTVAFDGSSLSSGVYFYRLKAGHFIQTLRMLLLR